MRMFKEFSAALFTELQFQQRTTRLTIVTEKNPPFEASAGRLQDTFRDWRTSPTSRTCKCGEFSNGGEYNESTETCSCMTCCGKGTRRSIDMTTVQPHGLDVPRRRDGRLHRRQVFVYERKDEMCSMMQTRVNALGWNTTCV